MLVPQLLRHYKRKTIFSQWFARWNDHSRRTSSMLKELPCTAFEAMLEGEMDTHLGHPKDAKSDTANAPEAVVKM